MFGAAAVLLLLVLVGALLMRARDAAAPVMPAPEQDNIGETVPASDGAPTGVAASATPIPSTVTLTPTVLTPTPTDAPTETLSGSSPITTATVETFASTQTPSPTATASEPTPLPPAVVLDASGSGQGSTPEVDLPPGVYRVFFDTDVSGARVAPVALEGHCSASQLFPGTTSPEESATYRSTGCRVRFDVEGISAGWTLRVETVTMGGMLTPPVAFSGDGPTTTGLIDLPEGDYLVAFGTNSPYSMVTPIIVGGPCLERPILILTESGQFEATYQSTGCQVVFQVSSVTAGWELTITRNEQ